MNERTVKIVVVSVLGLILVAAFSVAPIPGRDDWRVFYSAGHRILSGEPLYGEPMYVGYYYFNAPWLAILMAPVSLLPYRLGLGVLSTSTLALTVLVVRRWESGLIKPVIALLSPPIFYILIHGQVDAIVLAGILLPSTCWGLVALAKPQVASGLLLPHGELPSYLKMIGVTVAVLLFSFLFFGIWPLEILRQPAPIDEGHNIWLGLWPWQVPVGLGIAFYGMNRKDERFLIAASPFFSPYAAISSLLGPWVALATLLKPWQATAVLIVWWGAVAYRAIGGVQF